MESQETEWVKKPEGHQEKMGRVVTLRNELQIVIGRVRYDLVLLELELLVFSCKIGWSEHGFPWELMFK